ncbi:hypothetical protein F53441_12704 [Fusarium austroafricanum]|uniref:BZIP domain-containing protein n=1 Tax=Fusarium austroafricanum TaxID=2364996 RepID=A0A8H4JXF4_9HYPO|nr:hypothetical protein F53441_12704 [Fusarium austroafricanum]
MDQSAALPSGPPFWLSAIDNFDTISHPSRDQWYFEGQPSCLDSSAADASNSQLEFNNVGDFSPDSIYTLASTEWTGSIFPQEYPAPHDASKPTNPEEPSNIDGKLYSRSILLEKGKGKLDYIKDDTTKSPKRNSTEKRKSGAAEKEVDGNKKGRSNTNKATVTDSSFPPLGNNIDARKVKERNRRASNKIRVRKREEEKCLESTFNDIEKINRNLSACVKDLTQQIYGLKTELLQHVDCDCTLIQEYISHEAHRYVQDHGDTRDNNGSLNKMIKT